MSIMELKDIKKSFPEGEGRNQVLKGINLEIGEKESIAILGKSGSGKSTLMNLIGGLDTPDSGEIYIEGKLLQERTDKELSKYRRSTIGFVFQSFNLIPVLSVLELLLSGVKKYGQTLLMITHNQEIAKMADRVIYMKDGCI